MFKPKSKAKVLNTLDELARTIQCPKCCKVAHRVCINECGHTFCRRCTKELKLPDENGKIPKCPICSKYSCLALKRDEVMGTLVKKTLKLKELVTNHIENSRPDEPLKQPRKRANSKESIKKNFKNQDQQTDTLTTSLANQYQQTDILKTSSIDHYQQTDSLEIFSVGIQCDIDPLIKLNQCTVSTQTSKSENECSDNSSKCHAGNCCLNANLQRILQLNICDSFNAIISGLLSSSGGEIRSIQKTIPENIENKSNSKQEDQKTQNFGKVVINHDDPKSLESVSNLQRAKNEFVSPKIDLIETANKSLKETLSKENDQESQEKKVEATKVSQARPRRANNKSQIKVNSKSTIDSTIKLQSDTVDKMDNEDDAIFVKPKNKAKPKSNAEKSLKRLISTSESISCEDSETSQAIVAKKSKRIETKKKKDALDISKDSQKGEDKLVTSTSSISSTRKKPIKEDAQNTYEFKSDESNSSLSRTRSRSSSTEKVNYLVMCSNLTPIQKGKIEKASSILDFEITEKWSRKVTHLVVNLSKNSPKKDLLTTRSIKYLMALLGNNWIVSFDWMTASLNSNKFVDEKKYEVRGVMNSKKLECPMLSRTQKLVLFSNCVFYFNGNFDNFPLDINDVKSLVEIGGGILANDQDELSTIRCENDNLKLIVITDSGPITGNPGANYISMGEFLDAITNLQAF